MSDMGKEKYEKGDFKTAFEYWIRAAALGDVMAHYQLSVLYHEGTCVEKDEKKKVHHAEQAAIAGHPLARHNLACVEMNDGRMDRAAKHFIIAAKLGFGPSLEATKRLCKSGHVSKEDFAAALRGHHAAIKATESDQRKEALEVFYTFNS